MAAGSAEQGSAQPPCAHLSTLLDQAPGTDCSRLPPCWLPSRPLRPLSSAFWVKMLKSS